jgi:predicted anti-sigma-YlaC factor YlaD
MNCKRAQELLESYFAGELNQLQKALLEKHVASCQSCSNILKEEKSFLGLLGKGLKAGVESLPSLPLNWNAILNFKPKRGYLRFAPTFALIFVLIACIFTVLSSFPGNLFGPSESPSSANKAEIIASRDSGYPHSPPSEEGTNWRLGFY